MRSALSCLLLRLLLLLLLLLLLPGAAPRAAAAAPSAGGADTASSPPPPTAPQPARATADESTAPPAVDGERTATRGFWVELKVGALLTSPGVGVAVSAAPGLLLGYRTGRFVIGAELGAHWARSAYEHPDDTQSRESRSLTARIMPSLQVDLLRRDAVRLYLDVAAGVGYARYDYQYEPDVGYRDHGVAVMAELGVGVRYFLSPRFAVGAEAAATAAYSWGQQRSDGQVAEQHSGSVGLRGSLTVALLL